MCPATSSFGPKEIALITGVVVTFILGIANLIYSLRSGKRTAFVNAVTSERVKWIGKVRENVASLLAQTEQWVSNLSQERYPLLQEIDRLNHEIRLQLNPNDIEDRTIEQILLRFPNWRKTINPDDFPALREDLIVATQAMLKREWDKVKEESVNGRLKSTKKTGNGIDSATQPAI